MSGYRDIQKKSRVRQQSGQFEDIRSSIFDPPNLVSSKSNSGKKTGNTQALHSQTPTRPKEAKNRSQPTLFDVVGNMGNSPSKSTAQRGLEKQPSSPKAGIDDNAVDMDEDAMDLLNRFLRPGSSGGPSGSDSSSSPAVAVNPLKRPASAISKDDDIPTQELPTPRHGSAGRPPTADLNGIGERQSTLPPSAAKPEKERGIRPVDYSLTGSPSPTQPTDVKTWPLTENHNSQLKQPSEGPKANDVKKKEPKEHASEEPRLSEVKSRLVVKLSVPGLLKQSVREQIQPTAPENQLSGIPQSRDPVKVSQKSIQTPPTHIPTAPQPPSPGPSGRFGDANFTRTLRSSQQQTNNRKDELLSSTSFSSSPSMSLPRQIPSEPANMPSPKTTKSPSRRSCRRLSAAQSPPPSLANPRRSGRSRAGPSNYFAPLPGYRGHPEQADEDVRVVSDSPAADMKPEEESPPPEPSGHAREQRVLRRALRRSNTHRVMREPLASARYTVTGLIPYFPASDLRELHHTGDLLNEFKEQAPYLNRGVFHVDFNDAEMRAVYSILAPGAPCEEDIPIQDLVIQCVQKRCPTFEDTEKLAAEIKYLSNIPGKLGPYNDQLKSFLLEHRRGDFTGSSKIQSQTMKKICKSFRKALALPQNTQAQSQGNARLQQLLQGISDARLDLLVDQLQRAKDLKNRSKICLKAFLQDAKSSALSTSPSVIRFLPIDDEAEFDSFRYDQFNSSALLRSRALGHKLHRGLKTIQPTLSEAVKWEFYKTWKGASNDVLELCWSPDGTRFAASAAAQCDEHNMVYNRNNNLLLGDLVGNRLKELPDHRIRRPFSAQHGNTAIDPDLYMTVTGVKWSNCGERLYTSSYDRTVKVWDVRRHSEATCVNTIDHSGEVHVMAVSHSGQIATGCEDSSPFRVSNVSSDGNVTDVSVGTAGKEGMTPSSLAWGCPSYGGNLLALGMSGKEVVRSHDPPRNGHLAVWQVGEGRVTPLPVSPNSQNIFDIRWHPTMPIFATASTVSTSARAMGVSRDVRSLVRIYDPTRSKIATHEYDCPALDINDVTFCPGDNGYVSANCTDGATYVWDSRNPDKILHKLKHGSPLSPMDPDLTREQADVGVRLALWGTGADKLFTGASDGVLRQWNILRAPEDALVSNVQNIGQEITCGAFSADKNDMLVGDACGSVHVLSNAPWSQAQDGDTSMIYEPANSIASNVGNEEENNDEDGEETARGIARGLISSGQILRHPLFGAVQGPNYAGPFASWARSGGLGERDLTKLSERARNKELKKLPLDKSVKAQQFSGPPIASRAGLNESTREYVATQMQLAEYRNTQIEQQHKRKRESSPPEERALDHPQLPPVHQHPAKETIVISSDDEIHHQSATPKARKDLKRNAASSRKPVAAATPRAHKTSKRDIPSPGKPSARMLIDFVDLTMDSEEEMHIAKEELSPTPNDDDDWAEEDHWWPKNVDPNL